MTKTKLAWRLKSLPTPDEVRELFKDKIITQEEAREILFSQETEIEVDKKSLESEIKFLRELVDKLANGNYSRTIEIVREVERPWRRYPWYEPYVVWCNSSGGTFTVTNSGTSNLATGQYTTSTSDFSSIKTF